MKNKKLLSQLNAETEKRKTKKRQVDFLVDASDKIDLYSDDEKINVKNKLKIEVLSGRPYTNYSSIIQIPGYSGPRNSEELWHCVKTLFNISIPLTSTADYANAPFEWFASVYFGKAEQSCGLAARSSGKTYNASIMHYLWSTYLPNSTGRHAAATKEQAKVAAGYLQKFSTDPVLKTVFAKGEVNKQDARWKNNSHWGVVTGSLAGVSGQHPNRASWDEIEFWPIDAIEQTFYVPVSDDYGFRIWAAFSTRQRSHGAMSWLVDEAENKGIKLFLWTAFETMQQCKSCVAIDNAPHGTDTDRMSHCVLWEDCKGLRGTKSSGWVPREDVCKMKKSLSKNAWEVQGLCSRPSSAGLVLSNFEHAYAPDGNWSRWVFTPELPFYACHDPAEGKKSVIYFVQIDDVGRIHVFDEIIQEQCPNTSVAKQAFYERCVEMGYGDPEYVIVDPHRTDSVADWRSGTRLGHGIARSYNAVVPPMDNASGGQELYKTIEYLRKYICDGSGYRMLLINPILCPKCIRGVKEFHYPSDMNGNVTSDKPSDEYKDEVDPLRYLVMWHRNKFKKARIHMISYSNNNR